MRMGYCDSVECWGKNAHNLRSLTLGSESALPNVGETRSSSTMSQSEPDQNYYPVNQPAAESECVTQPRAKVAKRSKLRLILVSKSKFELSNLIPTPVHPPAHEHWFDPTHLPTCPASGRVASRCPGPRSWSPTAVCRLATQTGRPLLTRRPRTKASRPRAASPRRSSTSWRSVRVKTSVLGNVL